MEAIEAPVFRIALPLRRSRKSWCVPSATSSTRLQGSARAIGRLGPGCYFGGCSPCSTRQKRAASTRCCLKLCVRSSNKATQSTFHRFKSFSSQEYDAEEQLACSWSRACHQPQPYDSVRRIQSGPLPRKGLIRSDPHTIALAQKISLRRPSCTPLRSPVLWQRPVPATRLSSTRTWFGRSPSSTVDTVL